MRGNNRQPNGCQCAFKCRRIEIGSVPPPQIPKHFAACPDCRDFPLQFACQSAATQYGKLAYAAVQLLTQNLQLRLRPPKPRFIALFPQTPPHPFQLLPRRPPPPPESPPIYFFFNRRTISETARRTLRGSSRTISTACACSATENFGGRPPRTSSASPSNSNSFHHSSHWLTRSRSTSYIKAIWSIENAAHVCVGRTGN